MVQSRVLSAFGDNSKALPHGAGTGPSINPCYCNRHYYLPALATQAGQSDQGGRISRLPVSLRIVLESLLRNCDGKRVTQEHVLDLAR